MFKHQKKGIKEMQYDKDKEWVREVLSTADIVNTINGGMSEPQAKIVKKPDHYLITAHVPGVDPAHMNVEIVDKKVIVQHNVEFVRDGEALSFPRVVAAFPITPNIDFRNITASSEGDTLHVVLPFNELASGYRRHVDINF